VKEIVWWETSIRAALGIMILDIALSFHPLRRVHEGSSECTKLKSAQRVNFILVWRNIIEDDLIPEMFSFV